MKTTKSTTHHSGSNSNSLNKHIFPRGSQISSNVTSSKKTNEQIKIKNSNKNVLEMIYDDEFVIMINQLSTSIKNYYRANNKNFNIIKTILNKNELNYSDDNELMIETFNKIENTFSFFYSSAKQIFKNMKIYRRERIANILAHNKKKNTNNKNDNNINNNINIRHRNSGEKLNALFKSPNEYSSHNIFEKEKNKALSINKLSNEKSKDNDDKNISDFYLDNNDNDFTTKEDNEKMKNTHNYDEYFDVLNNYNKKLVIKSSSNIKEFNLTEEKNSKSVVNSIKREANSKSKRIYIGSLNKSDKKPKNNKISMFMSKNNLNKNSKRVKSSDKDIQTSFENKISNRYVIIHNNNNFETSEDMNEIIKKKENEIINLKTNKIHIENKIKELENTNNKLNEKITDIEKNIKEKEEQYNILNTQKENLESDNNKLEKKMNEIIKEKKIKII